MATEDRRTLTLNDGDSAASNVNGGGLGAPFPPRPNAIATFLSSSGFLPGCQTLLHSVKSHMPPTPPNEYPPEIIVCLSSTLSKTESIKTQLCPVFCNRIIHFEHIPIRRSSDRSDDNDQRSHVSSWDDNCGWTKLRLFELESYGTILYIDADCLVVKDVSHLLNIDAAPTKTIGTDETDTKEKSVNTTQLHKPKKDGLLAAAPDIFPPDKFNAGVMVLRPSRSIFQDMMTRLPCPDASTSSDSKESKIYNSCDGGDTGFLNSYYSDWYRDMPPYSRLPFGYNAQRFMYHCTYDKQPKYWDEGIEDLFIIHYSSSPKPWELSTKPPQSDERSKSKSSMSYLDGKDVDSIQKISKSGKLESMWQTAYEESQHYFTKESQTLSSKRRKPAPTKRHPPPPPTKSSHRHANAKSATPIMVQKRFRELRKLGMSTKDAMETARAEFRLDEQDIGMDPGKAVGQMFGLM